ncbi:MAG: S8 family peptidase [Terriglobales bacterium]
MKSKTSRTVVLVVLALSAIASANNGNKIAPDLQGQTGTVNIIVQFTVLPTTKQHQKVVSRGGKLKRKLDLVKGGAYSMPASKLADLATDSQVVYISPDRGLNGAAGNLSAVLDYHTETVNAPYAWGAGLDGTGVGVAVIDSGIIDSPDLQGRIIYSQSFLGNGSGGATDRFGHGSHVAVIIGGSGKKSSGNQYFYTFNGIAPNVNLIDLRVLDQNGQGTDSQVIAAIQTAISLKSTDKIRVMNLSLGRPVYESYALDPLCQAVEQAWQAGIVVVVSAGNYGRDNSFNNDGYATITSPANDPYVITVGAMKTMGTPSRADDLIATYSSKGPTLLDHIAKPDLVAPGNQIISLYKPALVLNQLYPGNEIPLSLYQTLGSTSASSNYYILSGTSMAAPMVSGTAALMLQQNSSLTPDQIKARLMKTAYKTFPQYSSYTDPASGITYTDQYDVFTVGAGYLDVQAALQSTDLSTGVARSPVVQYDPDTQTVYFVNDTFAVWGGNSPDWSSFAVWGGSVFLNNQFAVWGGSAPWGNSTDTGFFAVWGGSTIQSSSAPISETLIHGDR